MRYVASALPGAAAAKRSSGGKTSLRRPAAAAKRLLRNSRRAALGMSRTAWGTNAAAGAPAALFSGVYGCGLALLRSPGQAEPSARVTRAATDQLDLRTQLLMSSLFQPACSETGITRLSRAPSSIVSSEA